MNIRSLRELIAAAGLDDSDCLEKAALRERAREAQAELAARYEKKSQRNAERVRHVRGMGANGVNAPSERELEIRRVGRFVDKDGKGRFND